MIRVIRAELRAEMMIVDVSVAQSSDADELSSSAAY